MQCTFGRYASERKFQHYFDRLTKFRAMNAMQIKSTKYISWFEQLNTELKWCVRGYCKPYCNHKHQLQSTLLRLFRFYISLFSCSLWFLTEQLIFHRRNSNQWCVNVFAFAISHSLMVFFCSPIHIVNGLVSMVIFSLHFPTICSEAKVKYKSPTGCNR